MRRNFKSCIAVLTTISVLSVSMATVVAAPLKKNETVYVKLDSSGTAKSMDVVNWLDVQGKKQVEDVTSLSDVRLINEGYKYSVNKGKVSANLEGNTNPNLFYSGKTNKALPVKVEITYFLNGKPIIGKDLAGKKGEVEVKIKVTNLTQKEESLSFEDFVSGRTKSYSRTTETPFMINASVDLPLDKFRDVDAPEGMVTVLGKVMKLTFANFPIGANNGDKPEVNFSFKAKTDSFDLDPMTIVAFPSKPPIRGILPNIEQSMLPLYNGLGLLYGGLSQAYDGVGANVTALPQLTTMVNTLVTNSKKITAAEKSQLKLIKTAIKANDELIKVAEPLANDNQEIKNLLTKLDDQKKLLNAIKGGGSLADGSSVGKDESITASSASAGTLGSLLSSLPPQVDGMIKGTNQLYDGLRQLRDGAKQAKDGVGAGITEYRRGIAWLDRIETRVGEDETSTFTGDGKVVPSKLQFLMQTDSIKPVVAVASVSEQVDDNQTTQESDEGFFAKIKNFFSKLFGKK